MGLTLNNVIIPYTEAYGRIVNTMPGLIAEGRVPANTADVTRQRLDSGLADWKDNYFFVGDAIAYHPDGKFKIVLDAPVLRTLNPKSELKSGAYLLEDGAYETLQGPEFKRVNLKGQLDKDLTAKEVKAHPIWQAVARDQTLLDTYVDSMFPEMNERFKYTDAMGVYLENGGKVPTVRALVVSRLENGSWLGGGGNLVDGYGRLVGVAPEALSAPGKVIQRPSLETALAVVNQHFTQGKLELKAKQ